MQVGHLNVVIPPDIIAEESSGDVMVSEGNTVRLVCRAHGFPKPRVEWRREDGRKIALRPPGQAKNEGWCTLHVRGRDILMRLLIFSYHYSCMLGSSQYVPCNHIFHFYFKQTDSRHHVFQYLLID